MSGREKIDAALAYLKARGIPLTTSAPLLWRLFWLIGLRVPPPHFLGFPQFVFVAGTPFGLLMSVLIGAGLLVTGREIEPDLVLLGLASGLFFGLVLAAYYRWSASRLGLPSWRDFPPDEPADDTW